RFASAAADGHEQRVGGVTEPPAGGLLEPRQRVGNLLIEPRRFLRDPHVLDAGGGRDRESGRHPFSAENARHLRDVRSLAAKQVAHLARAISEVVYPPGRTTHADMSNLTGPRALCLRTFPVSRAHVLPARYEAHGVPRFPRPSAPQGWIGGG